MTYRDAFHAKPDLSAQFLRANAVACSGLWIGPSIPVAKLAAAHALIPEAQNQLALALVDSDQTGSAKVAMLVTSRAVYLTDPSARIPIEAIVQIPSFPAGTAAAGVLDTSIGSVPLGVHAADSRSALYGVLRAIALFNRGGFQWKYSATPVPGAVGELAQKFLEHEEIRLAPMLAEQRVHSSSSVFGVWLDHDRGESLIAYFDAGRCGSDFIALTDRRMIFRIADAAAEFSYDALESVDHDRKYRSQVLTLHTGRGTHKFATALGFLHHSCKLPGKQHDIA